MAEYTYDETNRMVKGVNSIGESSSYLFNGKNALVEQTWHIAKNGYGYHDVDAGVSDPADTSSNSNKGGNGSGGKGNGNGNGQGNGNGKGDKPTGTTVGSFSTVVKQFVIDYTVETMDPLMEHEVNGLDYRYVYGNERLSVNVSPITNGSGHIVESGTVGQQIRLYYHQDLRGTVDYLTSPVSQKVESWTHYNEWGEITHNAVLKCGQRELDLVKNYTGHDFDAVLNMYYAKARMFDAENRRFVSIDPILNGTKYDLSEYTTETINFSAYVYVQDNPLRWVDPLGLFSVQNTGTVSWEYKNGSEQVKASVQSVSIDGQAGYAKVRDLLEAYGFVAPDSAYKQTMFRKEYDVYRFKDEQNNAVLVNMEKSEKSTLSTIYFIKNYSSKNYNDTKLIEKVYIRFSGYLLAHHAVNINNENYMEISYFQELMCKFGYKKATDRDRINSIGEFKTRYGHVISAKAKEWGVDENILGGVIYAESGGRGFNDGKLTIRFENHIFRGQLTAGLDGSDKDKALELYKTYFTDKGLQGEYAASGHKFRQTLNSEWSSVHESQCSEYNALNLAISISPSEEYAYRSASYGIGQVMGFNYASLGYSSAKEMYEAFDTGYTPQLEGMFKFIEAAKAVTDLQSGDIYNFARKYNGKGNAAEYESLIRSAMERYKNA